VQTLLNVTNVKVCARSVVGKLVLARERGMRMVERRIWGMNARLAADALVDKGDEGCGVVEVAVVFVAA
jgi:hypothetical protein